MTWYENQNMRSWRITSMLNLEEEGRPESTPESTTMVIGMTGMKERQQRQRGWLSTPSSAGGKRWKPFCCTKRVINKIRKIITRSACSYTCTLFTKIITNSLSDEQHSRKQAVFRRNCSARNNIYPLDQLLKCARGTSYLCAYFSTTAESNAVLRVFIWSDS